jgi:hypothetical protein
VLAAVALRGLHGTVGEADNRAERALVIKLLGGERGMGHGGLLEDATASEGASPLRPAVTVPSPISRSPNFTGESVRRLATSGV